MVAGTPGSAGPMCIRRTDPQDSIDKSAVSLSCSRAAVAA